MTEADSPAEMAPESRAAVSARWAVDAVSIAPLAASARAGEPLPGDWIEAVLGGSRVTAVNRDVELLLGAYFPDKDISQRPIGELWPSESRADLAELILAVAADERPWAKQKRNIHSLLLRDAQLTVSRWEPDGHERLFIEAEGALEDGRSRWALRASEERYRKLIHHLPFALLQVDAQPMDELFERLRAEGVEDFGAYLDSHPELFAFAQDKVRITDLNHGAALLFGDGSESGLIGPVSRLFAPCPDTARRVMIAHFEGRRSYSETTSLRTLDGRILEVRLSVTLPKPPEQADVTLIGIEDISDRVRTEAQLRQVQADFSHAARIAMLGEMAASIAHEVNQPLAAIATNADTSLRWLEHEELDRAKIAMLASRIAASARRAGEIVQRIRDMAAKPAQERAVVDFRELVEEAVLFVRHDLDARKIPLFLEGSVDAFVLGDRVQIQQVIVNLLLNAVQAMTGSGMAGGRIDLSIAAEPEGQVTLAIRDRGPGIAAENLDRLFESFFTTKEKGLGIGLGICQSIVAAHGGTISGSNHQDGGALFRFSLPAAHGPADQADVQPCSDLAQGLGPVID